MSEQGNGVNMSRTRFFAARTCRFGLGVQTIIVHVEQVRYGNAARREKMGRGGIWAALAFFEVLFLWAFFCTTFNF